MRKREIKKYGNTWIIKLETGDVKDFGLVEGDIVDIDDLNLMEVKNVDNDNRKRHKGIRKKRKKI